MEKNKRMQFYGGTLGACAPLLVFMCLMIVIAAMKKVSLVLFCMAGFAGLCVAFLLAKNKKEFEQAVVDGLKNDTLCVIIFAFLLAGILSQELRQSGLIQGLTWLVMTLGLSAGFLPLVAFLVCLLISTACGTSNGAIVAVLPVLLPVAATVGANPSVVVGAIVSGAIFGDNLAPISDTTIASALTQDAEVRDVVRTRLPYSLIAGVISAVLFIIVGIKTSTSVTLPDVIDPAYAKTLVMLYRCLPPDKLTEDAIRRALYELRFNMYWPPDYKMPKRYEAIPLRHAQKRQYGKRAAQAKSQQADAEKAENAEERKRRKAFYLRNGLKETGLFVNVYDTDFELLTPDGELTFWEYVDFLREVMYEEYVEILRPTLIAMKKK